MFEKRVLNRFTKLLTFTHIHLLILTYVSGYDEVGRLVDCLFIIGSLQNIF